jgi:hypothetical protein
MPPHSLQQGYKPFIISVIGQTERYKQAVENFMQIYDAKFVGNCGELCTFETNYII